MYRPSHGSWLAPLFSRSPVSSASAGISLTLPFFIPASLVWLPAYISGKGRFRSSFNDDDLDKCDHIPEQTSTPKPAEQHKLDLMGKEGQIKQQQQQQSASSVGSNERFEAEVRALGSWIYSKYIVCNYQEFWKVIIIIDLITCYNWWHQKWGQQDISAGTWYASLATWVSSLEPW